MCITVAQQQQQKIKKSVKPKRIYWLRIGIVLFIVIAIIVVGLFNIQASFILSVLGIMVGLFQWLFPVSSGKDEPLETSNPQIQSISPTQHNSAGEILLNTHPPSFQHPTQNATISAHEITDVVLAHMNPVFHFNEPLTDYHEYYGRHRERTTLMSRVHKGASTSLVGPRKIGKTWLMSYLRLVITQESRSNISICYVDASLPSCQTVTGFTARILKELGMPITQAKQGLTKLENVVKEFRSRNSILAICIDEFEGFENKQEFDLSFFKGLRALTQTGLCLVVVSKNPLIDIVGENGITSGFFNVFEQLMLKPFSLEEAQEFIKTKGRQSGFTEQEKARVLQYGQEAEKYYPLLLQLAGKLLLEDKQHTMQGNGGYYHPEDSNYWQDFEERLKEKYRGVIR
jgi:Bacterial TniB protein